MGRFKLTGYDGVLAILAVAAVIDMAMPVLTTVALISIIGIPIAIMLMLLPVVAFILVLARLLQKAMGLAGVGPAFISVCAVLLASAALARHYNGGLEKQAEHLMAQDTNALQPLNAAVLGLGGDEFGWQDQKRTACNDLCLRLLLNGQIQKVAVFAKPKAVNEIVPDGSGKSFWLEQRPQCPAIIFQDSYEMLPGEDRKTQKAAEVMALKLATGTCLVEGTAATNDVDTLVLSGRVAQGTSDCGAGFNPAADTVSATRAVIFQRTAAGLSETFRSTAVLMRPHGWILAPTIVGCYGLEMRAALYRTSQIYNGAGSYFTDVKLSTLVADKLKLQLAVPQPVPSAADAPPAIITRALDAEGPIPAPVHRVIEDLFESFSSRAPSQDEKALALRALADPRVDTPRATWALARAMQKDGTKATSELATLLFGRMMTTPANAKEDHPTYLGWLVGYADNAINPLPDDAILPHKSDIEKIAHDPERRVHAHNTLAHLHLFGRDGLDTMLYLVQDAMRIFQGNLDKLDSDMWSQPLRAGLANLCKLGPDGASAIPRVASWLQSGERPLGHYNKGLVASTLLSMGASDDLVIQVIGGLSSDSENNNYRLWKKRVLNGKPDCD